RNDGSYPVAVVPRRHSSCCEFSTRMRDRQQRALTKHGLFPDRPSDRVQKSLSLSRFHQIVDHSLIEELRGTPNIGLPRQHNDRYRGKPHSDKRNHVISAYFRKPQIADHCMDRLGHSFGLDSADGVRSVHGFNDIISPLSKRKSDGLTYVLLVFNKENFADEHVQSSSGQDNVGYTLRSGTGAIPTTRYPLQRGDISDIPD